MDIRETKQRVLTEKQYYVLEHSYCCNQCKINGVEFISQTLYIYIITEVKNTSVITMNLNIEDCNGVTIAKFRNIEVNKINTYDLDVNTYDFDEELSNNLLIIRNEIEKNENYHRTK